MNPPAIKIVSAISFAGRRNWAIVQVPLIGSLADANAVATNFHEFLAAIAQQQA
jgi:hypothetical protein